METKLTAKQEEFVIESGMESIREQRERCVSCGRNKRECIDEERGDLDTTKIDGGEVVLLCSECFCDLENSLE